MFQVPKILSVYFIFLFQIITLESQLSRRNNMLTTFSKEIEQMQTKVDDLKKRLADEEGLKNMANVSTVLFETAFSAD